VIYSGVDEQPPNGHAEFSGLERPPWPQPLTGNCPELPPSALPTPARTRAVGSRPGNFTISASRNLVKQFSWLNKTTYFFVDRARIYCSPAILNIRMHNELDGWRVWLPRVRGLAWVANRGLVGKGQSVWGEFAD
jgi:hypothetical protein